MSIGSWRAYRERGGEEGPNKTAWFRLREPPLFSPAMLKFAVLTVQIKTAFFLSFPLSFLFVYVLFLFDQNPTANAKDLVSAGEEEEEEEEGREPFRRLGAKRVRGMKTSILTF